MRTLFLFFLLITFDVLKAQDDFYNPYFEIKAGDELMLLYDKVKVYEKANTSSKVIDKLPMGKSVVVKSNTIDRSIINGLELPWIEVSYEHDGKEKVGFLWSGFLSLPVENYAIDKSLTFLFGVSKIVSVNQKKNTELVLYMNCKVLSQGKLLAKKEFKSIYNGLSYYRNLNVYDNKGLNGIICGHIHHAEIKEIDGVTYMNDGDWVESCTALVEHHDGRWEIVTWTKETDHESTENNQEDVSSMHQPRHD